MADKYFKITEVVGICGVNEDFVLLLEREHLVTAVVENEEKLYPPEQVERVRVAHELMEMGVNLEGAEVALNMREQMIEMQRQFSEVLRRLSEELKK